MSQPIIPPSPSAPGNNQNQFGGPPVAPETLLSAFRLWFSDWGVWTVALSGAVAVVVALLTAISEKSISAERERAANERIAQNEAETAKATENASLADARAAEANKAAGTANERAAQLEKDAEAARLEISRANESAAKANVEAAKLGKELESAKSENLRIARALAPRIIDDQYGAARALMAFAPVASRIEYLQGDLEARRTARYILAMLNMAGWGTPEIVANPDETRFTSGVNVTARFSMDDSEQSRKLTDAARALASALNARNIQTNQMPEPHEHPPLVLVRVGMKPDPILGDEPPLGPGINVRGLQVIVVPKKQPE